MTFTLEKVRNTGYVILWLYSKSFCPKNLLKTVVIGRYWCLSEHGLTACCQQGLMPLAWGLCVLQASLSSYLTFLCFIIFQPWRESPPSLFYFNVKIWLLLNSGGLFCAPWHLYWLFHMDCVRQHVPGWPGEKGNSKLLFVIIKSLSKNTCENF